jgi:hypothetical protein
MGNSDVYRALVGKPDGRRLLERPKSRREYNTKMGIGEIAWGGVDWAHLSQDRDQWRAVLNTAFGFHKM